MPTATLWASAPCVHPVGHAPRAYPVRMALTLPDVLRAGLVSLLHEHRDRVEVLDGTDDRRAQIEIVVLNDAGLRQSGGVPRVALTWDLSAQAAARARDIGAFKVLPLSVSMGDLVRAVEQVHRDRPALLVADPVGEVLSPREADVVRGICQGQSNIEIARELFLSVNSVKTYVRTAYRKMGVASRSQAVLWGIKHGL